MSFFTWLASKLGTTTVPLTSDEYNEEFWNLASSLYVRELAFRSSVNLIAKAVAKCEFKTFTNGEEVKGDEWYLWNVEPNQNQSSSVFLNKLIAKLYEKNECLVVETLDRQLLVADSYQVKPYALYGYTFSGVTVDAYTFPSVFHQRDVLYFRLNSEDVRRLVNGLHEAYGRLAEYAQKAYMKSRGQKGILEIGNAATGKKDFEETLKKLMNERFKSYFESDSAVMPLTDGYKYTEQDRKTYNADSTRDIRAQIDDVFVFNARAFGIPPALLLGELADTSKAIDSLLTFCVDPLTDLLSEEINRKRNGKAVLKGTKVKIDTTAIRHVDLLSVATAIDKLISSGAFCVNDVRELVGDEPIDKPWAWQHWMTKNYSTVNELLEALQKEMQQKSKGGG